ncbi:MAG TPA: ATP-binding protein [Candidatus Binatia bacterium]|nr:ATP-binding protein [Candidatus Binatia bacterium]
MFFLERHRTRPRVYWTLGFIGALVLVINGTVFYSIRTSQAMLDVELGKRLEGTAQIAALLVRPEQIRSLGAAVRDSAAAVQDSVTDFVVQMDAIEASDKVRAAWSRLAEGAEASNVLLVDRSSHVLLRLKEPFGFERDVLTLDPASLATALIGEPSHSPLYEKDRQYLRSGYAPVVDEDGQVLGAVVVEGGSRAFRPLEAIRTSLFGAALFASLLIVLIWAGYQRTVGHLNRIEENLRHTDLLASVGQVAAGVAHEIRNPLAVLRGASQRLQKYENLNQAQRAELLAMIDEEVSRMGTVVQNFLDLSRRPKGESVDFELRPVLERSIDILRVELDRSKVSLEYEWDAPEMMVEGDPSAMHHVFLNLALNARDVMKDGGRLRVRVQGKKGEARIQFEDTGPGVPKAIRNKIFEPFYTTRATGTGLGLAFVDRIVTEHGGSVTVGSAPSGGALFEIRLPAEAL